MISFEFDSRDVAVWRDRKVERALIQALAKAGNDAARAMKAASNRAVRNRKRLKVAKVNRGLTLTFPKVKTLETLAWRMDVSGEPMPLAQYPHSQVRLGVNVSVNVGARKLVKSAFVATMRSGHKGVFRRMGKKRLPIEELFSSRISDVFKDRGFVPAIFARTKAVFGSSFERLLPIELGKVKP